MYEWRETGLLQQGTGMQLKCFSDLTLFFHPAEGVQFPSVPKRELPKTDLKSSGFQLDLCSPPRKQQLTTLFLGSALQAVKLHF